MKKRQEQREMTDQEVWELLQQGKSDEEVADITGLALKRVQSVRQRNGVFKRPQNDKSTMRIDDLKIEEKPIVGVPYVYQGKRYIDITGDIVDCGIAYQDIGTNPYQE